MRSKLVFSILAALIAFFGALAVANAAAPASSATPNVAKPGTVAARDGAPFCDDRAASQHAAEPAPAAVDEGTLLVAPPHPSCNDELLCTGDARAPQQDDLQRSAPTVRDVAIAPLLEIVEPAVAVVRPFERGAIVGARDGFTHRDNPPPRPIPWAKCGAFGSA